MIFKINSSEHKLGDGRDQSGFLFILNLRTDITECDSMIGIFGYASGTYKGIKNDTNSNYYRTPASWKAIVKYGKIKHWQVYCESKMIDEIVEKNKKD